MNDIEIWDPAVDEGALQRVVAKIEESEVAVHREELLGPLTTFGLGGAAAAYVVADTVAQLSAVLTAYDSMAELDAVPLLVLGKGSNTLISDSGFPGIVLKLGAGFKGYSRDGDMVEAGAAEAMPALASWVAQQGLAGLEFAAGIPATVGGSVRMNAGAHGGETGTCLVSIDLATVASAELQTLRADELHLSYRHSELPVGSVVVKARWLLTGDDPRSVGKRLDDLRSYRRATQPLRDRNCGSVFTNPKGDSAGRLIDAAGLKGFAIGGASVSTKHANFIVASRECRAQDVLELIEAIQLRVESAGGPHLIPEVRLVGHFEMSGK